ncbi:hypothetical protein M378DRAFT_381545 [Amanita muscaria Koide BX008]|uniref:Uncharacterized protein n=1 Tax=Amanita muscaria (strain Koide BX008) TaxID=946122 RepID=A0A0C2WMU7_AMAMK|nr:hypothetical protein M378DRAFT_381545 [Amanita muscaria Koide BX008]
MVYVEKDYEICNSMFNAPFTFHGFKTAARCTRRRRRPFQFISNSIVIYIHVYFYENICIDKMYFPSP